MIQRLSVLLLLVFSFWLMGCRSEEIVLPLPPVTATLARPTATPTSFPSPTATPIIEREWNAAPVVLLLHHQSAGKFDPRLFLPELVVYADGRVVLQTNRASNFFEAPLEEGYLTHDEFCDLLRTVEGFGFFESGNAPYIEPRITDLDITHIQVHAWHEQAIAAYALDNAIATAADRSDSQVSDAWVQTYELLRSYQPREVHPYIPEQLILWIQPETRKYDDPIEWSLDSVSLANLYESGEAYGWLGNQVVLKGEAAAAVYKLVEGKRVVLFAEEDLYYSVIVRPLFPYEVITGSMAIPEFESEPTQPLTCS